MGAYEIVRLAVGLVICYCLVTAKSKADWPGIAFWGLLFAVYCLNGLFA